MKTKFAKLSSIALVVTLLALFAFGVGKAYAQDPVPGAPTSGDGVVPREYDGNVNCQYLGYTYGFKIEGNGAAVYTGTFPFDLSNGGLHTGGAPNDPTNSVTLSSDGYYLNWMATLGIDAVIVKGGQDSNAYVYIPEDKADTGLASPDLDNGNLPQISHVEFCYDYELTATKTANAQYKRTYTWTIDKSVVPDSHSGFAGETFNSDYDVVVDQSYTDSEFAVSGEIVVNNPTPFTVNFSVSDSVGGTAATVSCPTYQLAPGASTTCTYSASLGSKLDGTNTATITSNTTGVGGATASKAYTFGAPTTTAGYETVNVTDSVQGALGSTNVDKTFKYTDDFACPTDASKYTNGVYKFEVPNTATIKETGQSDSAKVTVTCYAPVVTKDAKASYDETHTWDVSKSVDPESQSGYPGDILDWTWKVDVKETSADSNFAVSGNINVYNPADEVMTVVVSDALNDGTTANVDCDANTAGNQTSLTVAAGETGTCTYSAAPTGKTATKNTATATLNGAGFTGSADVKFVKNVIGGTATVTDDKIGLDNLLTVGTGPWQFTGSDSHTCESSRAAYFVNGVYTPITDTLTNWAYVKDGETLLDSDDATTTWTCNASFVDILKITNGVVDPSKDIRFRLYDGLGTYLNDEVSTSGDPDGQLQFLTALVPGDTYTICETPVPAGYTFEISVDSGNVLTYAGPPGAVDPTGEIQCFDFTAAASSTTLLFKVNNSYPGGAPRTPGYWKNWNTCSGGNQAETAAKLGGVNEGVFLLDNLLPQTLGGFTVNTCPVGVYILDGRNTAGKNMSSDAAYILARSLLAARLNQDAGACVPVGTFSYKGNDLTFEEILTEADSLLSSIGFNGKDPELGPKVKGNLLTQRNNALYLYEIIDDYNNSMLCTGEPSH